MRAIARFVLILTLAASANTAFAAAALTLAPAGGRPGTALTVTGTGFAASEAVDVYFDTTDMVLLVSSATGTLTGALPIPASAAPGAHSITAIGRRGGDAAQTALTVSTPWAQMGYGIAHLGFNPYENVISADNAPSLGSLWSTALQSAGGTPAVNNGKLFVGTYLGVAALQSTTGKVMWNKNLNETFYASAAVAGTTIYAASTSGNLYALSASNGATLWKVSPGVSIYGSPLVYNGVIYIGTYDGSTGHFFAVNATTGATLWSFAAGGIDGSAAFADGNVYFGSYDGYIYALNAATGALVWKSQTGGPVESSPAVVNHILYIGSDDDKIYAFNALNGGPIWSYTTGGGVYAAPAVANGTVYAGSGDGHLYALNGRSGSLVWSQPTGATTARPAAVANGVVYYTADNGIAYAASAATGSVLAEFGGGATYFGSPAVVNGNVYISSVSGLVSAYAPGAGVDIVRTHMPNPASLRPDLTLEVSREETR